MGKHGAELHECVSPFVEKRLFKCVQMNVSIIWYEGEGGGLGGGLQ